MKLIRIILAAVTVVLALTAIGASIVAAKSFSAWGLFNTTGMMGQGSYYGMMNGSSHAQMMGRNGTNGEDQSWMDQMHAWMSASGGMHEMVWKGLADALGMTPDELNAELANGKTIAQIAGSKGIQKEQLAAALQTSVKAGLEKAVADRVITQKEADQMLEHMGGNYIWMLDHMSFRVPGDASSCHPNYSSPNDQTNG